MKLRYFLIFLCILVLALSGCQMGNEPSEATSSITILKKENSNGKLDAVNKYLETELSEAGIEVNYTENVEDVNEDELTFT